MQQLLTTKLCTKCGKEKSLDSFATFTRKRTGKITRGSWCKDCKNQCTNAINRARREAKAIQRPKPKKPKHQITIEAIIKKHGGIASYLVKRVTPNRDELAYLRSHAHRFPTHYEEILRWVDHQTYG